MEIYDELFNKVPTDVFEVREQIHASLFIEPYDQVLELGARYGSVSVVINKQLKNGRTHVAVDPDTKIWSILEYNRDHNKCNFHIVKGAISQKKLQLYINAPYSLENGYGTSTTTSEDGRVPIFSLSEIEQKHNLKFNVLVADCEGFLATFFEENPWIYDQLDTVLYEIDWPDRCDYDTIAKNLKDHGLTNLWYGSHYVWKRIVYIPEIIYSFETVGTINPIIEVDVKLVNTNYDSDVNVPIHQSYKLLSEQQKRDYLKMYLMHTKGGGFCDTTSSVSSSWKEHFKFSRTQYVSGYNKSDSIGYSAFICKAQTPFTSKWYTEVHKFLDTNLDELKNDSFELIFNSILHEFVSNTKQTLPYNV